MMRSKQLITLVLGLAWGFASGQSYSPFIPPCNCPNNQDPVSDDYTHINITNGVLGATLGLSGTVTWITGCFPIENAECTTRPAEGSIQLGTDRGSALVGDGGYALTSGYPWGVYPGGIFITMRPDNRDPFVWGQGDARFSQAWPGASGYYIRRIWNVEDWDTDLRIDLIQSVARISLKVRNTSTETRRLSLRLASDVETGVETGPPYIYAQGIRPITVDTVRGNLPLEIEQNLPAEFSRVRGRQPVPNAIEFYQSRGDLRGASRYILKPIKGFEDATPIDGLVVAEWFFIQGTSDWAPRLFPDSLIGDTAINLFVNDRVFAPGQEREFVFYVSLTPVDTDVQPPLALGVEALPVVEPDRSDLSQLQNNGVFTVIANVTNQFFVVGREVDLSNVTVDIALPNNLSLASGETRTKTIPRLAPGETRAVSWSVVADPRFAGFATIRVSAQAPPAPNKSVSRTILISATANRQAYKGFQLASIPFTTTTTLDQVLNLTPGSYQVKRWNPEIEAYEEIDSIRPGEAFWLYLPNDAAVVQYATGTVQFPSGVFTDSVPLRLAQGWNQIGNPYPYPLVLGQIVIVSASNPRESITFFEAAQRGVIRGVLYYWDEFTQQYKFTSDPNTPLIPHRGYWIKANDDIELVFPPVFLPGTGFGGIINRSASETPNQPNNWRLQIIARTARGEDSENYIGLASGRAAGEVEEPPIPLVEVPVRLTILKQGTGAPLMQDVRTVSGTRHQFEFVVEAQPGEEVSLRFPNLRTIPTGYRLRLTDQSTGRTIDLRTTPEYRFVSTGRARFTLTVERASRGGALITSMTVTSAGRGVQSVSISYVLADDAQTEVRILGTNGAPVATLQQGRAATRGANTVVWNLRDQQGRAVPPGTYQVQIEARTEDGQVARMVRPLILTR
jgi:hypothetical protein